MTNKKKSNALVWVLVGFILLLGVADLLTNVFALIPVIGVIFSTIGDTVTELIQIILTIVLAVIASRKWKNEKI